MFYAIAVVLVLIADQGLKYWVSLNIELNSGEQALIPGFIKLVNIHNNGAAFGLLGGGNWRWVFVVVALAFAVIVVFALKRNLISGKLGRWAAVGVLAGAIGNCIDRVAYGYVVDMFQFEFLGSSRLNAIFNVADVFISCCGVLFCLYIIFGGEKSLAGGGQEEEDAPAPKRRAARSSGGHEAAGRAGGRSAGSHSRKPQPRRPAARAEEAPRAQRAPAEERTRIPVKEYSPRPAASRPARPVEPRPVDPKNPFAEWENAPKPAQPKPAAPKPAAEPAPERRGAPEARPAAPKPAPKPKAAETEFSLEDILAEFSDK